MLNQRVHVLANILMKDGLRERVKVECSTGFFLAAFYLVSVARRHEKSKQLVNKSIFRFEGKTCSRRSGVVQSRMKQTTWRI